MDIFTYLKVFGNVIADVVEVIKNKGAVTIQEIEQLLDDALTDMGLLIPKDSDFFAALVKAVDAIIAAIIEGQKLSLPPKQ